MEISTEFLILIPIIIGVVQVVKVSLGLQARYTALLALILGIAGGLILGGLDVSSGVQGIIAGLSASGLWSGAKNTFFS